MYDGESNIKDIYAISVDTFIGSQILGIFISVLGTEVGDDDDCIVCLKDIQVI